MAKKKERNLDWAIRKYMPFFEDYGMNEQNIRNYFVTWSKDRPPVVGDYLWHIFNQLLVETAKAAKSDVERYKHEMDIRRQMLCFRRDEGLKANIETRLLLIAKVNLAMCNFEAKLLVKVLSGSCCEYCDRLNGRTFTPEKFLTDDIIPGKCTRETGCRCTVTFQVIRDNEGNIVTK